MRKRVVSVVVLALGLGLLAGCGDDGSSAATPAPQATSNGVADLKPAAAIKKVQEAAEAATSVHFAGTVKNEDTEFVIDVTAAVDGDAQAAVSIDGDTVELRVVGDDGFVKASEEFWSAQGGAAIATLVKDKWVKFAKDAPEFESLSSLTDFSAFLEPDDVSKLKFGEPGTVNGVAVFALVDPSASEGGTFYAASTGDPLPVQLVGSGATAGNKIDFDKWNEPVVVEAPPAADVIDSESIG